MLGFRGTFPRVGKACSVPGERFPGREKLARFRGNVFPGGETLPRCAGTFSQAGKPCRAAQEHFPKRENLAALRRNIFPGGKTLPRCAAGFQRSYVRRRLPLFAHIRAYAIRPYSFWRNTKYKRHHPSPYPQRINGKYVGAYRIRPPHGRTCRAMGNFHGNAMVCSLLSFPVRPHQGVCDTPLQLAAKNSREMMPSITVSHRTNGK